MNKLFRQVSAFISAIVGTPYAFLVAGVVVIVWALTGSTFNYSDTWQLVINTGTTIVTFLMVFLIQNTQNRDAKATQIKLDELIRAAKGARNSLVNIEKLSDEELDQLQNEFIDWRDKYAARLEKIKALRAKRKTYYPDIEEESAGFLGLKDNGKEKESKEKEKEKEKKKK